MIKYKLVKTGHRETNYPRVLLQGSVTTSVETPLNSAIRKTRHVIVIDNGAYGARMADIARYLDINCWQLTTAGILNSR